MGLKKVHSRIYVYFSRQESIASIRFFILWLTPQKMSNKTKQKKKSEILCKGWSLPLNVHQNYSAFLSIFISRFYTYTRKRFQEKIFQQTTCFNHQKVESAQNSLVVLLKDGVHLYIPDTHTGRKMFIVQQHFCPE